MILRFSLYVQAKAHWHGTSLRGKSASVNFRLRDGRQTTDPRLSPEFGIVFGERAAPAQTQVFIFGEALSSRGSIEMRFDRVSPYRRRCVWRDAKHGARDARAPILNPNCARPVSVKPAKTTLGIYSPLRMRTVVLEFTSR